MKSSADRYHMEMNALNGSQGAEPSRWDEGHKEGRGWVMPKSWTTNCVSVNIEPFDMSAMRLIELKVW